MKKIKIVLFFLILMPILSVSAQEQEAVQTTATSAVDSFALEDQSIANLKDIPIITLDESELGGSAMGDQNISSLLGASRDPFYSAAIFSWGSMRFKIRGYDNDQWKTLVNGVPLDYIENGYGAYSLYSGLNDVTRNRENVIGIKPTTFTYSGLGGAFALDTRASKQRKQLSITYSATNRSYRNRLMLTYGSGLTKKNWAFSASVSGRWAKEGYIDGTNYQGISYFASIEKVLKKHSLSLTTFGAPVKRGKATPVMQEVYDLAGSNYYNPNWGYQEGEKRNAKVEYNHQPTFILNHDWDIKENINLNTSAAYSFGHRIVTGIDWYNAYDPRPDYYRNLPSYAAAGNYSDMTVEQATQYIKDHPEVLQVNWNKFYEDNTLTMDTFVDRNGDIIIGNQSSYILANYVQDIQRANFNSVFNVNLKKDVDISAGLVYQFQKSHYYREVKDLLGGDFFLNKNQFGERDFPDNENAAVFNLDDPSFIVKEGDKYSYDYDIVNQDVSVWGQVVKRFNKFDIYVAGEFSNTRFFRNGYFKSGLFPDNSKGKSAVVNFHNYSVKGGATYKINGRNYISVNAIYQTKAPYYQNVFVSARTRDFIIDNPQNETDYSVDLSYTLNTPKVKLKASGYYSGLNDVSKVKSFYDERYNSFGNIAITNIDEVHFGGEFGLEYNIAKGISATVAAAVGRFYYTDRMKATTYVDNTQTIYDADQTIYSKNFRVSGTPQQAYSLGLSYRSPKYWFISLTSSFFNDTWADFSPVRRTDEATDLVPYASEQWNSIVDQERINDGKLAYTLDLFAGYSWRLKNQFSNLKKDMYLVLNVGVNNITNRKDLRITAFEQLRFDFDTKNTDLFKNRYAYAYGINYFVNLALRIN
ncbi:MAG: TonB-dependent receptor [Chitinophagales bacterium]|nr:TonB-dependent receptor [Chitinophagales bacterium]